VNGRALTPDMALGAHNILQRWAHLIQMIIYYQLSIVFTTLVEHIIQCVNLIPMENIGLGLLLALAVTPTSPFSPSMSF
jgi:hypothetical protein